MNNIKNPLAVFLPSNFDADGILDAEKVNVTKRKNLKASMYYILNALYELSMQRKYRDYFDNFFSPILSYTLLIFLF